MDPLLILAIGVAVVLGMIIALRMNAFLALITAAMVVSLLSPGELADKIKRVAVAFGDACGGIGIVIALAAVIGKCLMDSGAADRIVRAFLRVLGEKRASVALCSSGFVLAIPVFFDTVFYLLVPLARSLFKRTNRNYLLYVSAIATGGAITHTLVPPTPGPLFMAGQLGIDFGWMMLMGAAVALPTAGVGLLYCKFLNWMMPIEMRPYAGEDEPEVLADEQLPPLWLSLLPVLLPVLLITTNTVTSTAARIQKDSARVAGDSFDWPSVAVELTKVGTDEETGTARRLRELMSDEVREDLVEAAESGTVDAALEASVKAEVLRLVKKQDLWLDPAFYGIGLDGRSQQLLDRAVRQLSTEEIERFNEHYRDKAFAGKVSSAPGRELLTQAAEKMPEEDRQEVNWRLLESAFGGQVRSTWLGFGSAITAWFGNPNLALLLSALIAMFTLRWNRKLSFKKLGEVTETALMSGGVIILITAAGGAFGKMLQASGVRESIEQMMGTDSQGVGLAMLLGGFLVAAVLKVAQGSSTVAMIATSAMFAAMGASSDMLGCHLVYLATAIGSGSLVGSWMNDSGFWIFARMSGLTELEALKSWTTLLLVLGLGGMAFTLLFAYILPLA